MRFFGVIFVAAFVLPWAVQAQDEQTLMDIRQELEFVYAEIVSLKRDLSTTGNALQTVNNGPALQRIDMLEAEVRRITGQIEAKQNWIKRIVTEGTKRVGDLEFRLCELEVGCDIGSLDRIAPLGGQVSDLQATSTGRQSTSPLADASENAHQRSLRASGRHPYTSSFPITRLRGPFLVNTTLCS